MAKSKRNEIVVDSLDTEDKSLYSYTDEDAPSDLVVNNSTQTLIVGAEAKDKSGMSQRIDIGDRRQGRYFAELVIKSVGLVRVKDLPRDRLIELENMRQVRSGERPAAWVFEARDRAARGHNPKDVDSIQRARSNLEIARRM